MQMYHESENPYFLYVIFNMDISLIIARICLEICMCIAEISMGESIPQKYKKSQKLPVFLS